MTARPAWILALLTISGLTSARSSFADGPPPVPATRAELKQFLEDSKGNQPRIPLPALTAEEQEKMNRGDWSVANNGRTRKAYLLRFPGIVFVFPPRPVRIKSWHRPRE